MFQIKTSIGYIDARKEVVDTVIIAEDGAEYIRTSDETWKVYKEPELEEVNNTNLKEQDMKKIKKRHRPPSLYNIFFKEYMKYISENYPELNGKDRMKIIAEAWGKNKISV